jgi:iron uptake system component EfeO
MLQRSGRSMIRLIPVRNMPALSHVSASRQYAMSSKQKIRSKYWLPAVTIFLLGIFGLLQLAKATTLDEAAEQYRPYLIQGISEALSGARALQERVAAKDLAGAKKAWLSGRAGWERFEVFTGAFVPDLDDKIDAWPNAKTGFHAIEARLFGAGDTNVESAANTLVEDLIELETKAHGMRLTPQGLMNGTVQLVYEVGEAKSDGGESRISGTSLDDMRNNVAGIEISYNAVFSPAIESADPKLADAARSQIEQLKAMLNVSDLNNVDTENLRRLTEELAVTLQNAAPKIGLGRPALESAP